jgi:hypothetical protein
MARAALLAIGFVAALMGLVWMGQGSGYFPYPAVSPMINQSQWIWWGALLAACGVAAMAVSRRIS